jgi:predicted TIM-barrel fold metal-dependent hydrolase
MKIIDADCHITMFSDGIQYTELLNRMDKAGVDQAITWLQPNPIHSVDEGNGYVYAAWRNHPDRILPFGWAEPHHGIVRAKETIKRCVEEYGFHGIKLNGAQNYFFIDDEKLSIPLIEAIAATGKLLAFHIGTDAFEQTHPFRLGKIARRFPETRILAIHMGGVGHRDLTAAMIEIAAECPNITLVGSEVKTKAILQAIKTLGAERVCFGSDTPFELMHVEVAKYHALLDGEISPAEKALVMGGNMARLVG